MNNLNKAAAAVPGAKRRYRPSSPKNRKHLTGPQEAMLERAEELEARAAILAAGVAETLRVGSSYYVGGEQVVKESIRLLNQSLEARKEARELRARVDEEAGV